MNITDEDDGELYGLGGDSQPKEPCLKCAKPLPLGAILCNYCGYNRQTGVTHQRIHEKVVRRWVPGLEPAARFGVFLTAQVLALMTILFVASADKDFFGWAAWWLVGSLLMTYVLGTFPVLNLARNKKGRIRLTRTWRVCFVPLETSDIRWHGYEAVVTSKSHQTGFEDWFTVACLVPLGVIPAILWWYYIVRPDHFDVELKKDHGCSGLLLFRGRSETTAQDIAAAIRHVTGLP